MYFNFFMVRHEIKPPLFVSVYCLVTVSFIFNIDVHGNNKLNYNIILKEICPTAATDDQYSSALR